MYPVLIQNLRSNVTDQLISAMTTSNLGNGIDIGTPCLIDIGSAKGQGSSMDKLVGEVQKALEAGDIDVVNEMMTTTGWSFPAMIVFPYRRRYGYMVTIHGHQVYCFLKPPIIYDQGKVIEAESLKSVMNSRTIKAVPEKILDDLKTERYITYVIAKMSASKYKDFIDTLKVLFGHMNKSYPHNTCSSYMGDVSYTILDTIALSFYRLADMIPIFDSRKIQGFAMEITLTNATMTVNDIGREGYMSSVAWLFSKDEDNVFTIDGENIKRQNQVETMDAFKQLIQQPLQRHLPNDKALKKKSAKSKNGGN